MKGKVLQSERTERWAMRKYFNTLSAAKKIAALRERSKPLGPILFLTVT